MPIPAGGLLARNRKRNFTTTIPVENFTNDIKSSLMSEKMRFFDYFNDEELSQLLKYCALSKAEKGDAIINQGEVTENEVYLIVVGSVAVELESPRQTLLLCILEDGEVFGEYSLFTQEKRSATVRALAYTEVLHIDLDRIDKMFKKHPALAFKLVKHIAREASKKLSRKTGLSNWESPG